MRFVPVLALLALSVASCASPNPALYTLAPVPGAPVLGHQAVGPKIVLIRQIGLARFLDRQQIVRSSENYRLDVQANDWWGEPLGSMLGRVLAEDLTQRLPGTTVYPESGAVSVTPDATVELNIQRLDADAAGHLVLAAQAAVTFEQRRGGPIARSFRFSVPPAGPGVRGEVAAMSTAIGRLADGLATMLRR